MKKESQFQKELIVKLKDRMPECMVIKQDPNYIQGIPDLLILNGENWAALEVKRSKSASVRPNQKYYVDKMNDMSKAKFISPENEEEVLDEIQRSLTTRR